jgi:hypothetical protein
MTKEEYSSAFIDQHRYTNVEFGDWYQSTLEWFEDMLTDHGLNLNKFRRTTIKGKTCTESEIYFEDRYGWDCWFAGYFLSSHQALREIGASRKDFPITYKLMERGEVIEFKTLGDDERRRSLTEVNAEEAEGELDDLPEMIVKPYKALFAKEHAKLEALLQDWYDDVRSEFASILEDEYDYLTSDEAVIESLEGNGIVEEREEDEDESCEFAD